MKVMTGEGGRGERPALPEGPARPDGDARERVPAGGRAPGGVAQDHGGGPRGDQPVLWARHEGHDGGGVDSDLSTFCTSSHARMKRAVTSLICLPSNVGFARSPCIETMRRWSSSLSHTKRFFASLWKMPRPSGQWRAMPEARRRVESGSWNRLPTDRRYSSWAS